jgi:DHA1 family multidrug resistance protein-like MFS transporter
VLTVALAQVGFDLTQPFVPLFVRSLNVRDVAEAALWSGLIVGIGPMSSALTGPIWGALADRYGRKPMVIRALIALGAMNILQSAAPTVEWLFGIRFAMGLLGGFVPMAMALAVSLGPRERIGEAVGLVQAAQLLPTAIGPAIGGVLSDHLGLRTNFVLTGAFLLLPIALVVFLVRETPYGDQGVNPRARRQPPQGSAWSLFAIPGFAAALATLFLTRLSDRALPPILPLYLVVLETPDAQLATITGLVVSIGAVSAAVSSIIVGRLSRARSPRTLLLLALAGGALCSAPLAFAESWQQVLGLRFLLGLVAGGSIGMAYTLGARLAPEGRSGLTLSVLASCGTIGASSSPMLAGLLGQFVNLHSVFLANSGLYVLALGLTALLTRASRHADEPNADAEPAGASRD